MACQTDADCGYGYVCVDGECIYGGRDGDGSDDGGGGGSDGGSDGGGGISLTTAKVLSALGISSGAWKTLKTFANNPVKAISGIAFSAVVSSALGILEPIIDAFSLVLFGSDVETDIGTLGLLDLPFVVQDILISTGGTIETTIMGLVRGVILGAGGLVPDGILAFPVGVATIVLTLVAAQRALTALGPAAVSGIPVIGTPLARLLDAIGGS